MPWFTGKTRAAADEAVNEARPSARERDEVRVRLHRTRRSSLMLGLGALLIGTTLAACAGTPDNGTQPETLATFAARATEDATVPTPAPGTGSPSAEQDLADLGRQLAEQNGCVGCHSIDGSVLAGPTWQGLVGHEVELSNGDTLTADRDYIAESIRDPSAKIVDGYADIMPKTYEGFTDEQIDSIIAYMESLP